MSFHASLNSFVGTKECPYTSRGKQHFSRSKTQKQTVLTRTESESVYGCVILCRLQTEANIQHLSTTSELCESSSCRERHAVLFLYKRRVFLRRLKKQTQGKSCVRTLQRFFVYQPPLCSFRTPLFTRDPVTHWLKAPLDQCTIKSHTRSGFPSAVTLPCSCLQSVVCKCQFYEVSTLVVQGGKANQTQECRHWRSAQKRVVVSFRIGTERCWVVLTGSNLYSPLHWTHALNCFTTQNCSFPLVFVYKRVSFVHKCLRKSGQVSLLWWGKIEHTGPEGWFFKNLDQNVVILVRSSWNAVLRVCSSKNDDWNAWFG